MYPSFTSEKVLDLVFRWIIEGSMGYVVGVFAVQTLFRY